MRSRLLVLCSLGALVLSACAAPGGAEDLPEDVAEEVEQRDEEDAQETADCEVEGKDSIRIGVLGVMSGAHADYGRQIEMGATLAAEEINKAGGVRGCEIELQSMDDELDPDTGITNVRYLVEQWGADFIVGVDSSGVVLALAPVMDELDRILVATHAATEQLNEVEVYKNGRRNVFRVSVPVYQDAIVAAKIVADMPEITRIANIGADYEYGRTSWDMFKKELSELRDDVEFVEEAWAPFLTTDFSPHISTVMAKDPDMIFSTPWAGEAVALIRQAQQAGTFDEIEMWWQAMGGSIDVLEAITEDVQQDAFNGKLWATGRYLFNYPDTEENRQWVQTFQERWDRLPNYSAQTTYAAVNALAMAVEDTGSVDTDEVGEFLAGLTFNAPAGEITIREEDHQAVYEVPAGRVVYDEEWEIACVCADLKVFDAEEYYREPPFED